MLHVIAKRLNDIKAENLISFLIGKGVDVNAATTDAKTPLTIANELKNTTISKIIIGKGGSQGALAVAENVQAIKINIAKF